MFRDRKLASAAVPDGIWCFDIGSSHVTQAGLKLVTLGVSLLSVNGQVPSCLTVILTPRTISKSFFNLYLEGKTH